MSFTAATYNLLASAYIQRAWYRRTAALVLDPAWRVPALVRHVAGLGGDILCLQEVEAETFVSLRSYLGERGYGAHYARKWARRPEGVAIFYRHSEFELRSARVIAFADGGAGVPDSGYIALMALFHGAGRNLGIINTHLSWDPPGVAPQDQVGRRQCRQLVSEYEKNASSADGWIVAGDFNAEPRSDIVTMIEGAGLRCAHGALAGASTCNVNGAARMIDYLFHSPALLAEPQAPTAIDHQTILPSAEEPSDHVALQSRFSWRV